MERAIGELGLDGAEVVSHSVVEGSGATEMDLELRGSIEGEDSVFLSRIVIAGADFYELNVVGRSADEADLRAMHERLVGSFELAG